MESQVQSSSRGEKDILTVCKFCLTITVHSCVSVCVHIVKQGECLWAWGKPQWLREYPGFSVAFQLKGVSESHMAQPPNPLHLFFCLFIPLNVLARGFLRNYIKTKMSRRRAHTFIVKTLFCYFPNIIFS